MGQTASTAENKTKASKNSSQASCPKVAECVKKEQFHSANPTIDRGVEALRTSHQILHRATTTENHLHVADNKPVVPPPVTDHRSINGLDKSALKKNEVLRPSKPTGEKSPKIPTPTPEGKSIGSVIKSDATVTSVKEKPQTIFGSNQNLKDITKTSIIRPGRGNKRDFIGHRLFLGGLPEELTQAELRAAFEKYGKVTDVVIALDNESNKSKRYGFVGFKDQSSAESCLKEHFVIIKEKRVEVKKAWPRKGSKERENENKNDEKVKNLKVFPKKNIPENFAEASSIDGESNAGDNPLDYQKLFNDYFKAKFAVQNLLGSGKVSNVRSSNEKLTEEQGKKNQLENLLKELCISIAEKGSTGDFSSDSTETDSETDEVDCFGNDVTTGKGQKENNIQSSNRLICTVCEWTPRDNSIDSFLAHCNTLSHRQMLKERFEDSFEKTSTKDNHTCENCNSSQKTRRRKRKSRSKSRCRKQSDEHVTLSGKVNKKNEGEKKSNPVQKKSSTKGKYLKCQMCNKGIPSSQDPRILMANLSQHLQSKRHLANLEKCEGFFETEKN